MIIDAAYWVCIPFSHREVCSSAQSTNPHLDIAAADASANEISHKAPENVSEKSSSTSTYIRQASDTERVHRSHLALLIKLTSQLADRKDALRVCCEINSLKVVSIDLEFSMVVVLRPALRYFE